MALPGVLPGRVFVQIAHWREAIVRYDAGMNHYEAFAEAINANPEDRTPQLVFADWLDENGQSDLAEAWRVIVEADRLPFYLAKKSWSSMPDNWIGKWHWFSIMRYVTEIPLSAQLVKGTHTGQPLRHGFASCFEALDALADYWAVERFEFPIRYDIPGAVSPMANAPRKAWQT